MPTAHQLLLDATCHQNAERVAILLANGADPNIANEGGIYPLFVATTLDRFDFVQLLLRHGAEVTSRVTPEGEPLLFWACGLGNLPIVREMLGAGANPDERHHEGLRALDVLARGGSIGILKEFIQAGARIDVRDEEGYAPIHHAAETGNLPALHELVRAGSSHAWRSNNFMTPLAVACMRGHSTFVEYLYDNCGADPSAVNGVGQTPLTVAAVLGHVEVVKVLLGFGVRQLGPTAYGDSLCGMAMSGNVKIMRELVHAEGGVHIQGAETPAKLTALHMAAGYCHPLAISMLLEAGADETVTDFRGKTAFDIVNTMSSEFVQNGVGPGRVRRMLEQAPAFRARSWAWPDTVEALATASENIAVAESPTRKEGKGSAKGAEDLAETTREELNCALDSSTAVAAASEGTGDVNVMAFCRPAISSRGSAAGRRSGLLLSLIRYSEKA